MTDQPPESALGPNNQRWRRWVEDTLTKAVTRIEQKFGNDVDNAFKATSGSLKAVSRAIEDVQEQADDLAVEAARISAQQNYLNSLVTQSASNNTGTTTVSTNTWANTNQPSVTIATSTGKLRVTVSALIASLGSGGTSYIFSTFSIPGYVTRDSNVTGIPLNGGTLVNGTGNALLAGPAAGIISGSYTTVVTGLPVGVPLTIIFECRGAGGGGYFCFPTVIAEVIA